ncbi:hypothetical protein L484_006188 [Morus notabilis]|uniref:Uncharacterized protein n=1 Tax=Morus notabilis TaxID=981085 RepID=W9RTU9_9ROSA|nr:hypothetical protein L484_006188 [Morus notabilis]
MLLAVLKEKTEREALKIKFEAFKETQKTAQKISRNRQKRAPQRGHSAPQRAVPRARPSAASGLVLGFDPKRPRRFSKPSYCVPTDPEKF